MNDIIGESLKSDSKLFWSFVKSQKRESLGVPTLKVNGRLHVTDKDKAEALNQQYCSVFSTSDNSDLPDLGHSPYPDIDNLDIGINGVTKQLKAVKVNKASGPDEVPARMLHDYAEELIDSRLKIGSPDCDSSQKWNDSGIGIVHHWLIPLESRVCVKYRTPCMVHIKQMIIIYCVGKSYMILLR